MTLVTHYPGAAPEDVELNVTIPIEKEIKALEGIDKIYSTSNENVSRLNVVFDKEDSARCEKLKQDIRRALDSISEFPPEITEKTMMFEWGGKYIELMAVGIRSEKLSEKEMQQQAKLFRKELENSPFVSKIDEYGQKKREIQIRIDLNKLNHYYLSFENVIQAIESHNIQATSGTLKSYTTEKNIVTLSRFKNILDVKNVIIRSNYSGQKIRLSDIAAVIDTFEQQRYIIRFNGHRGILFEIFKKQNSDIVKASHNINKIIERFKDEIANKELDVIILEDNSSATRDRLKIVTNNAIIGLGLVVFILFIFLNFKNAFWTALSLPFSICFCLFFLPLFNVTINSVSLLGIILVLGMIVDDAIVISENIFRHNLNGETSPEAAVKGSSEVGFAVLTTILTTIIAFMPLMFVKGFVGDYSREIPIIISLILIGSLLESLFILPAHTSHILPASGKLFLGILLGLLIAYSINYFHSFKKITVYAVYFISSALMAIIFIFL